MTNKLAIIGGSGLYDIEDFKEREFLDIRTPWGTPSDQILKTKFNKNQNETDTDAAVPRAAASTAATVLVPFLW